MKNNLTPKKVSALWRKMYGESMSKEYSGFWKELTKSAPKKKRISMVSDVLKFADVSKEWLNEKIIAKISGHYTYYDTDETLSEHLYSIDILMDEIKFNKEEKEVMTRLKKDLDAKDCGYFRLIQY